MATNLQLKHLGINCKRDKGYDIALGEQTGLHFNAAVKKPPVKETRPALQEGTITICLSRRRLPLYRKGV